MDDVKIVGKKRSIPVIKMTQAKAFVEKYGWGNLIEAAKEN
jgi:hypothetical protein